MKIGIFFGGQSREREVSFAGGRTVYDNLNKQIFEPVPVFVDSLGNFILLDWQYIYKGTIRDFYPPVASLQQYLPDSKFQVYAESLGGLDTEAWEKIIGQVGKKIHPQDFHQYFDFAFLALHGPYGEDGNLQGLLEWYNIPYSGSGILPSAIGIDKMVQQQLLAQAGFARPRYRTLSREAWAVADKPALLQELTDALGLPLVIKSPNQGSSIGVTILKEKNIAQFEQAVQRSLFEQTLTAEVWHQYTEAEKDQFLIQFTDIRDGLGFPIHTADGQIITHPQALWHYLDETLAKQPTVTLRAENTEAFVLFEQFIAGKEFSCIVIQHENGEPVALPPTEIRKFQAVFDYRSKYLPGMSRKITPIEAPTEKIEEIRVACAQLFKAIYANVYARIDGFLSDEGAIYLNDPNTTSGMMPSSFFFHQAAEIGLNPSQFLTYIIRTSLSERLKRGKKANRVAQMLQNLDQAISQSQAHQAEQIRVAVIMGGYSSERHISMESGRNIYEKLASSPKYSPFPVFLTGNDTHFDLYEMPINIMLKDNADDIRDKILHYHTYQQSAGYQLIQQILKETEVIRKKYAGTPLLQPQALPIEALAQRAEAVFIALHGRPGEDGKLQQQLEAVGLPYNGSGIESSQITINKYETNEILSQHGIAVARHRLVHRADWEQNTAQVLAQIAQEFGYPLIAKPADDGCSSAVKKLKDEASFRAFAAMMFRPEPAFDAPAAAVLQLKANEEFPQKDYFLVETLIEKGEANHFLEITGGLLTHIDPHTQQVTYEMFEPSEVLALGDVLSLEEKFLAGEGQNITPARYAPDEATRQHIAQQVKAALQKTAEILKVEGYARIDAFVKIDSSSQVQVYVIEVNSLPGMTPATCIFHQCALNHYKPYHFIDAILDFGMRKKRLQNA